MRDFIRQALLIDSADLLQQYDRIPVEAMSCRIHLDMRGQLSFLDLGRDGGYDYSWAESVANVILNDENGTDSALLRADDR